MRYELDTQYLLFPVINDTRGVALLPRCYVGNGRRCRTVLVAAQRRRTAPSRVARAEPRILSQLVATRPHLSGDLVRSATTPLILPTLFLQSAAKSASTDSTIDQAREWSPVKPQSQEPIHVFGIESLSIERGVIL